MEPIEIRKRYIMLAEMTIEKPTEVEPQVGQLSGVLSAEIVEMISHVGPSVVQVNKGGRGGGAGVIWRADGAILTNHHVVAGRGGPLEVLLPDGRRFGAEVVSANAALDLALLKVEADDLPAALVDDSSQLRVGEMVFAVGHPWGQKNVVTAGIVSGLGETPMPGSGRSAAYVRSDVRVAPGNSGGPLLNARGAVVGITAMIFGGDMTAAIPSKAAIDWVAGLPTRRVYLGVGVQPVEIPATLAGADRTAALLVVGIDQKGPANRAGLFVGDILLNSAGRPLDSGDALLNALSDSADAGILPLDIVRGGALQQLEVSLDDTAPPEYWD